MSKARLRRPVATLVVIGLLASLSLFTGLTVVDQKPAGAAVGQLPASFKLTALGGLGAKIGSGSTGTTPDAPSFEIAARHPAVPNECADGLDNEAPGTDSGGTIQTSVPDNNIDSGDAQCAAGSLTVAADDSEGPSTMAAANASFPTTLQSDRVNWQINGTNTAGTLSVPVTNIKIPYVYSKAQVKATGAAGVNPVNHVDNISKLIPIAYGATPPGVSSGACAGTATPDNQWGGTSSSGGVVTLRGCAYIEYDQEYIGCLSSCTGAPAVGTDTICRSKAFEVRLTTATQTGATGNTLTGQAYDTTDQTLKLVATDFTTNTRASGWVTTVTGNNAVCNGTTFAADAGWAGCSNGVCFTNTAINKMELLLSSDSTYAPGGANPCLVSGVPQANTSCWPTQVNGPAATQTVNEGSAVSIGAWTAFDPAGRPSTAGFGQTSGAAPPVIKNNTGRSDRQFVPGQTGGSPASLGFGLTETAPFGQSPYYQQVTTPALTCCQTYPGSQVSTKNVTVTVNNVAPTANAGLDQRVTPGTVTLKGSSSDPSDSEASRTYAWACTAGPACVDPADTKNSSVSLSTTGTYTFQLSVNDGDGGIGTDTVNVTVVPAAGPTTLSGRVTHSATGATISGATVSIYTNPAFAPVATTSTDGSGNWAWGSAVPATSYWVKYTNAGMVDTWYRSSIGTTGALAVTAPNALVDGQTGPARTISGTVTAAVGGANVTDTVRLYDENGWIATTTSTGGAYSFTNMPAKSTYRVQVAKGSGSYDMAWYGSAAIGGATLDGGQATKIDVSSANFTTANVTLYTPTQSGLTGTVTGCGGACASVQVRFYQPTGSGGAWVGTATANGSGVYNLPNLRPGTYRIWFWTKWGGAPGATSAITSEWYNGLNGEQYQNTGLIADTYTVPTGPGATLNYAFT